MAAHGYNPRKGPKTLREYDAIVNRMTQIAEASSGHAELVKSLEGVRRNADLSQLMSHDTSKSPDLEYRHAWNRLRIERNEAADNWPSRRAKDARIGEKVYPEQHYAYFAVAADKVLKDFRSLGKLAEERGWVVRIGMQWADQLWLAYDKAARNDDGMIIRHAQGMQAMDTRFGELIDAIKLAG